MGLRLAVPSPRESFKRTKSISSTGLTVGETSKAFKPHVADHLMSLSPSQLYVTCLQVIPEEPSVPKWL